MYSCSPSPFPYVSHVPVHCSLSRWCHIALPTRGLVLSSLWKPAAALFLQPIRGGRRPPSRQHCRCTLSFCVTILKLNITTDSNIFLWLLRVVHLFIYLLILKWCKRWLTGDYWCEISSGCSCYSTPFDFFYGRKRNIPVKIKMYVQLFMNITPSSTASWLLALFLNLEMRLS